MWDWRGGRKKEDITKKTNKQKKSWAPSCVGQNTGKKELPKVRWKWDIGNQNWSQVTMTIWASHFHYAILGRGPCCLLEMQAGSGVRARYFLSLEGQIHLCWHLGLGLEYFHLLQSTLLLQEFAIISICILLPYREIQQRKTNPTEKNTINKLTSHVEPTSWALLIGHQWPTDTKFKQCCLRNLHI